MNFICVLNEICFYWTPLPQFCLICLSTGPVSKFMSLFFITEVNLAVCVCLVWAHPWRIGILSVTHPQRRVSLPFPAVSTNPFMLGFWLASCRALLMLITTTVGSWVLQLACFLTRSSSPSNDNEDHILYFFDFRKKETKIS